MLTSQVETLVMRHRHADRSEHRTFPSVKLVEVQSRISLGPSRDLFLGQPVAHSGEVGVSQLVSKTVYLRWGATPPPNRFYFAQL